MAGTYSVTASNVTVIASGSLICVRAATAITSRASLLSILEVRVSQAGTATSQQLGIVIAQKVSAFGTFTTSTPSPINVGGPASGISGSTSVAAASAGTNASANGGGATTNIISDSFNVLNGWLYVPVPEERILIMPDLAVVVQLVGTPTTLTGWSFSLVFTEVN